MLEKCNRFRVCHSSNGSNRGSHSDLASANDPVKKDFAVPAGRSNPRRGTLRRGRNSDDVLLVVPPFVQSSVLFMIVKHRLTRHSRRNRDELLHVPV